VAGVGILGYQIARALHADGHEVTALELDDRRALRVRDELDVKLVEGDCSDPQVLERAGIADHDAFLALTGLDEDNLVSSLVAKTRFAVPRVIARINDPSNSWLFDQTWGIDVAMSAPAILVSLVEEATAASEIVNLLDLATAGVRVVETSIGPANPYVGRRLAEVPIPDGVVIATVIRHGQPMAAGDDTELQAGDQVLVVVRREAAASVDDLFAVV